MPQRGIKTEIWTHPDFQELPGEAKLLYIYLWSNSHCKQSGLYTISLRTISFESGINIDRLPELLDILSVLDIEWFESQNIIWVKKFLKHQANSPQFLSAVAKDLNENISDAQLIIRYLQLNNTLSIPYQYSIDTSTDTDTVSDTVSDNSSSELQSATIPEGERALLSEFLKLPGWGDSQLANDVEWLSEFLVSYPNLSVEHIRACRDYHSSKKSHTKGQWKVRVRNWLKNDKGGRNGKSHLSFTYEDPDEYNRRTQAEYKQRMAEEERLETL